MQTIFPTFDLLLDAWHYCAVPVELHRFVRLVVSAHPAMVTPTQAMSFSQCYTGTTYMTAIIVEIKAMGSSWEVTGIKSPGAKSRYVHAKTNSQGVRAALGGSNPSLLTPNPNTLGLERLRASLSADFFVSQTLLEPARGWGWSMQNKQSHLLRKSRSLMWPCLLHGTLQTFPAGPWGSSWVLPGRERSAPAGTVLLLVPQQGCQARTEELTQTLGLHLLQRNCNSPSSELA